jgi:[glutamine synthetase] adenylyltransferase / [glutamine synthetase]-adenylyl-L-tyrosine phosphorylase
VGIRAGGCNRGVHDVVGGATDVSRPTAAELAGACAGVEGQLVEAHLDRLGDDYYAAFPLETIARHLDAVARLCAARPVQVVVDAPGEGDVGCTVIAFDYAGVFSLIAGVLAATGFSIQAGHVFTSRAPAPPAPGRGAGRRHPGSRGPAALGRRYIIDHFRGVLRSPALGERWPGQVTAEIEQVIGRLESGRREDADLARHRVNELVAERLRALESESRPALYPVDIRFADRGGPAPGASGRAGVAATPGEGPGRSGAPSAGDGATLRVVGQDTPAFLYALSTALALQHVSIEAVRIRTVKGVVEDELDIQDVRGQPRVDPARLDRIRLLVLLTKQFTHFLPGAPDPYAALLRFEQLAHQVVALPDQSAWLRLFADPGALRDLARILGTSDFIWEDFVRRQYEELLPLLQPAGAAKRPAFGMADLTARAEAAWRGAATIDEAKTRLNEWKDREIFLIDLDHILHARADVRALAEPSTRLAEVVVRAAAGAVYGHLAGRHGTPRTVGGLAARFAVFGLGKMGGVALGYASDIELLFVYSDSGQTDGEAPVSNAEFFDRLAEDTARFIQAKQEGIFRVDLRLRPYGHSGPKACSLESFCLYYGGQGAALDFERLALTRLRAVAGDAALGAQVERLRDQMVYESAAFELTKLRRLRERQLEEKSRVGRHNAKFSPGALVDVEYYVQVLQVQHGKRYPALRTPRLHQALAALADSGILEPLEADNLARAYDFLRRLINGLRMLRGNALDLFLPAAEADEYVHLARRMGYAQTDGLAPERQLLVDFETCTALVRDFITRHFGRHSLPDPTRGNVVDLVLAADPPVELRRRVLAGAGFRDVAGAYVNLRKLAGTGGQQDEFARLAVLAADHVRATPDPDMALNNWERFVSVLGSPREHYGLLSAQPQRLQILLAIFAGSQFLADTLFRNPEFLDWVTTPQVLHGTMGAADYRLALGRFAGATADGWLDAVRRFRRREILRIGTRDLCLGVPIEAVTSDLSSLAAAVAAAVLERVWERRRAPPGAPPEAFCVMAFGKLGGMELNYSSDIDLFGVFDAEAVGLPEPEAAHRYSLVMEQLRADLSSHTAEGYAYRVDYRLRPHGRAGLLALSLAAATAYYRREAALWEIQALLKLRPVAGNLEVGRRFLGGLREVLAAPRDPRAVCASIRRLRRLAVARHAAAAGEDVKSGVGGIRDVEFLVQGLQLIHLHRHPELAAGNTLQALERLAHAGILGAAAVDTLRQDYLFMRRIEHFLQLLEDRQVHVLPSEPTQQAALARRALGTAASADQLRARIDEAQTRIRAAYEAYLP